MYRIDTMYEAMTDALMQGVNAGRIERWMASAAFWLGRQQVYASGDYWLALAAKITSLLPAEEQAAIIAQLGKQEDQLVDTAGDWPEVPSQITTLLASWSPTPIPVDLAAYTAAKRYTVEVGGIVVDGVRILTDRASQAMIAGAYVYVQHNPTETISFKSGGGFVTLSAANVVTMANAVGAHVQACFAAEAAVLAAIAAETITDTAGIDAFAWPANGAPA
ncbi:DUF4376 domain-containing protein [Ensifer sp. B1-9]|uniref:DUF4376 domain-containing protein n=1 Tax=Ensifer sp. B1-9 TaxID=3141455 RepID=UPI003D1C8922